MQIGKLLLEIAQTGNRFRRSLNLIQKQQRLAHLSRPSHDQRLAVHTAFPCHQILNRFSFHE